METAPRTDTSHEARARNAKAMALATVLVDLESVETPDDVDLLDPEDWAVAAAEATRRELLGRTASGKVRKVHVPGAGSGDPQATIDAVARILGDLIAAEADRQASIDQTAPTSTCPRCGQRTDVPRYARCDCDDPDMGYTSGPFCGMSSLEVHQLTDTERDALEAEHAAREVTVYDRHATDSAGYRAAVRQLDDETARTFAMFANGGS